MWTPCGSNSILGGYNGYDILPTSPTGGYYFQRIYTDLPSHNQIYLNITIYPIDSWDGSSQIDHFAVNFDGVQVIGPNIQTSGYATVNTCGEAVYNYVDYPAFQYYISIPHTALALTLQVVSYLNSAGSDESLGFRDIIMEFATVTTTSTSYCGRSSATLPTGYACSCQSNQYMSPTNSGTCYNCTSPCLTCTGGATNQCTSCIPGYYLVGTQCYTPCDSPLVIATTSGVNYCNTPCPSSIVYWDGSCETSCASPLVPKTVNTYQTCTYPCADTEYLYMWNGSCLATCPTPFTASVSKGKNFCYNTCTGYLYWNASCLTSCPSPLVSTTISSKNYCNYPCKYSWQFLDWNGTCSQYCEYPLSIRYEAGHNYCDYLCAPSKFLAWNGTCLDSCPSPLITRTEGTPTRQFCDYPCTASQYLYWNGSCLSTCPSPLSTRAEGAPLRKFCHFPCSPATLTLYDNSSCLSTCSSPFITTTEGTPSRSYCSFPCSSGEYWSTWLLQCVSSCKKPLVHVSYGGYDYCNLACADPTQYYMSDTGKCSSKCKSPYTKVTSGGYLYCQAPPAGYTDYGFFLDAPLDPDAVTFVTLVKLMQYVRYLDIDMPSRLERLGVSRARNVLDLKANIDIPTSTVTNLAKRKAPPEIFESHSLSPGFVVNYWDVLISIMIGLGIIIFLHVLQLICKKLHALWLKEVLQVLKLILGWGYTLMIFTINIDDIILYGAMEFKTISFVSSTKLSSLSFFLCLTFIGVMIAVMVGICIVVKKCRDNLETAPSIHARRYITKFERAWDWCQIFYRGFRALNWVSEYFYLIYMIRIGFPMLIVVWSYQKPVIIPIFEILVSLCILAILIYQKPFQKRVNHIQLLIVEAIVLLLNVCMLIITGLDVAGIHNSSFAIFLGDVVIIGNVILNFLVLIFLFIRLILEIRAISAAITKAEIKGKRCVAAWLQLLALPLQQANMGFEEMITYDFTYICPKDQGKVGIMQVIEDDANRNGHNEDETEVRSNISFAGGMEYARPVSQEKLNDNYTLNKLMPEEKQDEDHEDETARKLKDNGDFRALTPTKIGRKSTFFSIIPSQYESWDPEGKNKSPESMNGMNGNISANGDETHNYGEISLNSVDLSSPVRRNDGAARRRLVSKVGQRSQNSEIYNFDN